MNLASGGHLTHGAAPNQSGKWFNAIQYGVRKQDSLIDYDEVAALAKEHQPKLIIAGGSAIPRQIDFAKFREIADSGRRLPDGRHGPLSPVWSLQANTPRPSPMPMSPPRRRTRPCAVRAAA